MMKRRTKPQFVPWLLAVAFLAVQALAFAHELQHDLQQHDDPSCVLHLHTKHAGHPAATVAPIVAALPDAIVPAAASGAIAATPILGYRTRAPPLSSSRSI